MKQNVAIRFGSRRILATAFMACEMVESDFLCDARFSFVAMAMLEEVKHNFRRITQQEHLSARRLDAQTLFG